MAAGWGVRCCCRVDALSGDIGSDPLGDHRLEDLEDWARAAPAVGGPDLAAWHARLLVLVTADGTTECGGRLPELLEHRGGRPMDDAVPGDSFARKPLRSAVGDQPDGTDYLLRCRSGSAPPDACGRPVFLRGGGRANSLTIMLAAAVGDSALSVASVPGLFNDRKLGDEDGAETLRVLMRCAICSQSGLDVGVFELAGIPRNYLTCRSERAALPAQRSRMPLLIGD